MDWTYRVRFLFLIMMNMIALVPNTWHGATAAAAASTVLPRPAVRCCTAPPEETDSDAWQFKLLLLAVAVGYGTNFPVGRLMNEALPAAASTSGRFLLAALALSPFISRLDRRLIWPAVATGLCDGVGYSAQSLALCDTAAAKVYARETSDSHTFSSRASHLIPASQVSFLGALTVVVVPCLSAALDGKRLGLASAPQVLGWVQLAGMGACLASSVVKNVSSRLSNVDGCNELRLTPVRTAAGVAGSSADLGRGRPPRDWRDVAEM